MKANIVRMINSDTIARRIKASRVQKVMEDERLQEARRLAAQLEKG